MQDHRRARRMKPRADGSCDGRAPAVFGSLLPVATVIPAILLLVCSGSALAMSSRRRVQVPHDAMTLILCRLCCTPCAMPESASLDRIAARHQNEPVSCQCNSSQVVESPSESSPLSDSSDSSEDSPVSGRTRDRAGSPSALSSTSSTSEASCAVGVRRPCYPASCTDVCRSSGSTRPAVRPIDSHVHRAVARRWRFHPRAACPA